MIPSIVTVRARSLGQFDSLSSHRGGEFVYVLRVKVEVHTAFYEPVVVRRGDALHIDSTMGHATLNAGACDALVLSVCTSPRSSHLQSLSGKMFAIDGKGHLDLILYKFLLDLTDGVGWPFEVMARLIARPR